MRSRRECPFASDREHRGRRACLSRADQGRTGGDATPDQPEHRAAPHRARPHEARCALTRWRGCAAPRRLTARSTGRQAELSLGIRTRHSRFASLECARQRICAFASAVYNLLPRGVGPHDTSFRRRDVILRCAVALGLTALSACAPRPAPASLAMSSADSARCAAIADSLRAHTPMSALPLVTPTRRLVRPPPPRDGQPGVPVRTVFLVRPDGFVDTASVAHSGTADDGYRRAMTRTLASVRFNRAIVDGCPVWGRGDIQLLGVSRTRPAP